jgi:hypothetical protein
MIGWYALTICKKKVNDDYYNVSKWAFTCTIMDSADINHPPVKEMFLKL